jgi:hypothetical protein
MDQQDKRHIPQSSGAAHNAHTRPAESGDNDKLRENPHNDERVITQQERSQESNPDLRSGSTFAEKDEDGMNRVTNEQEQNRVVNPQEEKKGLVNSLAKRDDGDDDDDDDDDEKKENPETEPQRRRREPEIPADPDYPTENPYERIGDDPSEMDKKLPRM